MKRSPLKRNKPLRRTGFKKRSGFKSKPSLGRGKKTREWEDIVRPALSEIFFKRGVTYCEFSLPGCEGQLGLSFSHGKNRPKLEGDELWSLVVLSCTRNCHAKIEPMPKAAKLTLHLEAIKRRGWQVREGGRVETTFAQYL